MPALISTIVTVVKSLPGIFTSIVDQDIDPPAKKLGSFLHFLPDVIDFPEIA